MSNQNNQVQSGEDLANQALGATKSGTTEIDEVAQSDQIADTLNHLQGVIERNAHQLEELQHQLKEKRESLRAVFESDAKLVEIEEEAKKQNQALVTERARVQSSPTTLALKTQVADLREQQKEIEETLNSHLLNYFQLTNSTSFDTSDGDQWDFKISAKLKKH